MSYKKFENSDLFYNVIKAKPRFEFKIWDGKASVNSGTGEAMLNGLLILPAGAAAPACDNAIDFSCEDNSFFVGII